MITGVDKFLAWMNVRLMLLDEQLEKTPEAHGKKHDIYVRINELKRVRESYCRNKEVQA